MPSSTSLLLLRVSAVAQGESVATPLPVWKPKTATVNRFDLRLPEAACSDRAHASRDACALALRAKRSKAATANSTELLERRRIA